MMKFNGIKIAIILIIGAGAAYAQSFSTKTVGSATGLSLTSIQSQMAAIIEKLDSNQLLTNSDLENLQIDTNEFGGYPLDSHELKYISDGLSSVTLEETQNSMQEAIDGLCSNCEYDSADWMYESVVDNASSDYYDETDELTVAVLDELIGTDGYVNALLGANDDADLDEVQDSGLFTALNTSTEIKNIINDISGFLDAVDDDDTHSNSDYSDTQDLVDDFLDNDDYGNFALADYVECYNNTEAERSGGADTCTRTASDWEEASSILTLFAEAKDDVDDNVTLTKPQLVALEDIDLSPLPANPETWQMAYVNSLLTSYTADSNTMAEWETQIATFETDEAAIWKIGKINDNTSGHPASDLTIAMLDDAMDEDGLTASLLAIDSSKSITDISSEFPDALTTVTAASIQALIGVDVIGFDDADTVQAFLDNDNTSGFTVAAFQDCYDSSNSSSGGADSCDVSSSEWDAIDLASAIADGSDNSTLSASDITALLDLNDATLNSLIDTTDSVHLDYLTDCLDGASDAIAEFATCNTGFTAAKVSLFEVGMIIDGESGYPSSAITVSLLQGAGALDNTTNSSIVNGNYCGDNASSSCLSVVQNGIDNASWTGTPTASEIDEWIKTVVTADLKAQANGFTPTAVSGTACTDTINVNVPGACNHPSWTCTSSTSEITLTDNDSNGHVETGTYTDDSADPDAGTLNYTIRRTLTFYGGSSYYKDHSYSINLTAALNSEYSWVSKTVGNDILNLCKACPTGYRLATKSEAQAAGYSPQSGWYTDTAPTGSSGWKEHCNPMDAAWIKNNWSSLSIADNGNYSTYKNKKINLTGTKWTWLRIRKNCSSSCGNSSLTNLGCADVVSGWSSTEKVCVGGGVQTSSQGMCVSINPTCPAD